MEIKEAFKMLLDDTDLCSAIQMSDTNRRQFLHKLKNVPDTLTSDAMRKWLTKGGFIEKSDWEAPEKEKPAVETAG